MSSAAQEMLTALSALELRRLIGTRQISPVELLDACIARITALNPAINAICATDFERARNAARQAEVQVMRGVALGPLHGLPLGVKDLQDTAADRAFDVLRAESFVATFADALRSAPETMGPNLHANLAIANGITLADRAWAHLEQTRMARRFAGVFEQVDLVLAPVTPVTPFPWAQLYAEVVDGQAMENYYRWLALTYVVTLATNPALALPCGRDEHGMPFGLQLVGRLHGDRALLGAAQALEQAFAADPALARPRPDAHTLQRANPALRSIVTHPPQTTGSAEIPGGRHAV